MRRISDLTGYTQILPYDSEVFGVYQPLLGWRSKQIQARIERGFRQDVAKALRSVTAKLESGLQLEVNADQTITGARVFPAAVVAARGTQPTTFTFQHLVERLPSIDDYRPEVWEELLDREALERVLNDEIVPRCMEWQSTGDHGQLEHTEVNQALAQQLHRESLASGYLLYLREHNRFEELKQLFYAPDAGLPRLQQLLEAKNPLDAFDPRREIDRVGLSPIGIVHLYRQYFFEFDTFLGSPVGHVWLSPGSSVELMEIQTRKTVVERSQSTELETITKTEQSVTEQDEISTAVKQDNKSDTKFGMNANANQGWIGGSASASSSINLGKTQQKARETTHTHMRTQTDKLSTEIRKNFTSTFRTVTEMTDTSSKRYQLTNLTKALINYELRRKMRQVGVQVQDIGTYLCWQTYVDDPGRQLGVSRLVHLAKDPDVGTTPPPEAPPALGEETAELSIDIPFVQTSEDMGDLDEAYRNGVEVDSDFNEGAREKIKADFDGYTVLSPKPGYEFASAVLDYQGNDVQLSVTNPDTSVPGAFSFGIHLDYVNFRGNSPIQVVLKSTWRPSEATLTDLDAAYKAKVKEFNEASSREFKKAYVTAAIERVNMMRSIESRPFADLREEERIVVYRALIQDMLTKGISMPDDRTRHVVSELLNTIFDIDKMLYFVAPEWWRPRLHASHQVLGLPSPEPPAAPPPPSSGTGTALSIFDTIKELDPSKMYLSAGLAAMQEDDQVPSTSTVSWGGVGEGRSDNYYITSTSRPAPMGSSLGWLLQLDGDDLRNAFLNAPWVKAVIPVRPGQERAAMNWLQGVGVEGTDGLGDDYIGTADELAAIPHDGPSVTIRDAINHLCDEVRAKHDHSLEVAKYPTAEINDDNTVLATPLDKVYEHGFYPLQGGFKAQVGEGFEVFDQWTEVLPTDQVVPVEVAYDPITGRQVPT